jgi:glyoxylase-like metal-dependent hydrolase (beta-lactamase superfamily II)
MPESSALLETLRLAGHLRVHCLALGPMDNLVYVIEDTATGSAAVVDPGWDAAAVITLTRRRGLQLTDVFLTHAHDDHVNALPGLLRHVAPRVHIAAVEAAAWQRAVRDPALQDKPANRQAEVWCTPPPKHLERHPDGARIAFGSAQLELLHTPGHSPGSACYRFDDCLFTGDTLFVYGCGRCDLPGSDIRAMHRSLRRLASEIPGRTRILPGHHYAGPLLSSMAEQRRANPFLHFAETEAFVAFRSEHNRHRQPPYAPVPWGVPAWPGAPTGDTASSPAGD